ncbi:MAG: PDZ domain-containing protein, partial [Chthoniobacterales bacterium]|nr:PDZ domain-containing protein [Chthoniobacterales bacterium]
LEDEDRGVLVSTVIGGGSADGYLQVGDVLLSIDGYPIASDGTVEFENENLLLSEIVERKFLGESVKLTVLRNGERLDLEVPLKAFPFQLSSRSYRDKPPFVAFAGLIFQPVDADLIQTLNPTAFRLRFLFNTFIPDGIYRERPELITLASVLPDPVNTYAGEFQFKVLSAINGTPIYKLADVAEVLRKPSDFYVFEFMDEGAPLVLERSAVEEATPRIAERYRLTQTQHLETPGN